MRSNGTPIRSLSLLAVLLLTAQSRPHLFGQVEIPADTILVHGTVLTMDKEDSIAQALAIRAGQLVRVGSDQAVLALAGPKTQIVDLQGHTATPGLIDSHGHFASGGISELYHLDLSDAASVAEIVKRVQARVRSLKPGEWLEGDGWDEGKLGEARYVYAADLDRVAPDNPVWLAQTTGHYGVANSMALRLAGITAATRDPRAGTIDRNPGGAPSGVLKEAAMGAVTRLIPPPTVAQEKLAIVHVSEELQSEGMTAIKDADISPTDWTAYRDLLDEGKLTERVCVLWHAGTTMESARATLARIEALPRVPASLGNGHLLSCGAKLYMDGSGGARTAWMYQDWNQNSREVDTGNRGYPATDPATYREEVRLFHRAGVNVGTHAIGDRAIDLVVDTYTQVLQEKPTRGLRHSIIHANIPTGHAIRAMAALEKDFDAGYPESQPPFMWWIGDTYAGNFGPERSLRLEPLHTYLAQGVTWTGGSDYLVTPLAARYGIWASVAREPLKGTWGAHPFGTAEAVDIHAALRSYTVWAARQLFLEAKTGSLEPGKQADIAVWNKNPYAVSTPELKDLQCLDTYIDGRLVYHRPTSSQSVAK